MTSSELISGCCHQLNEDVFDSDRNDEWNDAEEILLLTGFVSASLDNRLQVFLLFP